MAANKRKKKNIPAGKRKKKREAQKAREAQEEQAFLETANEEEIAARQAELEKKQKQEAEQKKKEIAQQKKLKQKKENPGLWTKTVDYVKSTWLELKKTQWLTPSQLNRATGSVFGIVTIFTAVTWVVDSGLGALTALILGLK